MSNRVIIDTDPGIDDALAILYAYNAGFRLEGLTTVFGNASIAEVTNNAYEILDMIGADDIGIFPGASQSLSGVTTAAESSGANGNNGIQIKNVYEAQLVTAIEYIVECLRTNEKTDMICIGPLTNLAVVCNLFPQLVEKLGRVVVMGGEFTGKGNITKWAEFNVWADPLAFQQVLGALARNNVPTSIVPANICRLVTLSKRELEQIIAKNNIFSLRDLVEPFIDYYQKNETWGGFEGAVLYDVLATSIYRNEKPYLTVEVNIDVQTKQGTRYGQTLFTASESSPIRLVTRVDAAAVKEDFFEVVANPRRNFEKDGSTKSRTDGSCRIIDPC